MFCPKCLKTIPDDSIFCDKCGTKVLNEEINNDSCSNKRKLFSDLEKARLYFQRKQLDYDNFEKLIDTKNKIVKPNMLGWFIFGIILAAIAYLIIGYNFQELDGWGLVAVIFLGFGVVFPITQYNKENTTVNNQIVSIDHKLNAIETKLSTHFNAYPNSPISYEYSNPKIIDILKQNIVSGRADNIKESINCMLDDLFKQKMLMKQDEISKNAKNASEAANSAALFSAITFLNNRK